ncbi:CHAP domain-containing protein [Streptococcus oriscaviae]|uniref:CHAP domain-containing protein n=1 Tax=Streptococcus oriscaviae TaxID=2781599 RepID=A0ABX7YIS8_9STRE|nr:CHAP domain-containing protein [Streptococcus oriscaviae]QUE53547.1 CHAP domain-containing protein [Streptococcus oriscaviae]
MKSKKRLAKFFVCCLVLFPLILPVIILMLFSSGRSDTSEYTNSWSTGDPYTHNLFVKRFGITATQLDGYLASTGIDYDKSRINGRLLLEWERESGVDVRAIVAMAQMESGFGTAGVARLPGANMFGYGAFDSNPENAANYNDKIAIVELAKVTLKANKNESFKVQDDKARKHASGSLNVSTEGGLYFTDTSGSGKRRAEVMKRVDDFINANGGTPQAPLSRNTVRGTGVANPGEITLDLPSGYTLDSPIDINGYIAQSYPWGQCTWFVFNRAKTFGIHFDPYMGNGGDWKFKAGYVVTHVPTKHAAISFSPYELISDPTYGHVAFVEDVKSDGSILISEANLKGLGMVNYRVIDASTARTLSYVIGHR